MNYNYSDFSDDLRKLNCSLTYEKRILKKKN